MSITLADIVYNVLLSLASIVILPIMAVRRKKLLLYFQGFSREAQQKLEGRRVLWVQAVSVGEVSAVLPLLKAWREARPGWAIVLTTTTEGGQIAAHQLASDLVDVIGFFPLDFPFLVRRCLRQIKPEIFLMAELEIWPNFLRIAKSMDVWTGIVNGRISDRSFSKYRSIRPLLSSVWPRINQVCAQTHADGERFIHLGVNPEHLHVTGNIKFDITYPQISAAAIGEFKENLKWNRNQLILTAASTHAGEEEILLQAFRRLREQYDCRLLLAPRHPDRRQEVVKLLSDFDLPFALRSQGGDCQDPAVLLLDTFGELALAYAVSDAVFVGGSLSPIGGHNILEAAAQKRTPIYGPYMQNFMEIERLFREVGLGIMVQNGEELVSVVAELWNDPARSHVLGERAYGLIAMHRGATRATMSYIPE